MGQVNVFMFGARMHFAVPTILHSADLLGKLYNDFNTLSVPAFVPNALKRLSTGAAARFAERRPVGVPRAKNNSRPLISLRLHRERSKAENFQKVVKAEIKATEDFAKFAIKRGISKDAASFTYDRAGLEVMRVMKDRGRATIMEQTVAPAAKLIEVLSAEKPGFGGAEARGWDMLSERERQEWPLADLILCGSDFVRDGIIADGAEPDKCVVVPYGVNAENYTPRTRAYDASRPLRLLSVGEVGLRKGSKYLIEAARALGSKVEVAFVGSVRADEIDLTNAPSDVHFVGKLPRDAVRGWYDWADAFVLPSLFEGSATVTYEAMASGLPVICTHETGSIVEHQTTGLIIPSGQTEPIVEAIKALTPQLISQYSKNVLTGHRRWDAQHYRDDFLDVVRQVLP